VPSGYDEFSERAHRDHAGGGDLLSDEPL